MQSAERRSNLTLATFAAPCLPLAALGLPLVVYLPEFYANEIGLPLALVGAIFMAVRLLDIPFDPLIGGLIDRTRSRWGRFRIWMVAGTPLLCLATLMAFTPQPGVGPLYLFGWLVLLYIGWSICVLAQTSWASVLTPNYDQRSRTYAWWQAGNIVGMLLVLLLPPIVVAAGLGDAADGVRAMGWFVALGLPIGVALAVLGVGEPPALTAAPHSGWRVYRELLKRPAVRSLLTADVLLGLAPGVAGALFLFFFQDVREYSANESNVLLLGYFLGGFAGAALWTRLAFRVGKHRALAIASVAYAALHAVIMLVPKLPVAGALPLVFLAGVPYAASMFLLRAMMADVGDETRLETGEDRTGVLYALLIATSKVGYAVSVGITFGVLDLIGFDAREGGENEPGALFGLAVLFIAGPALLAIAAAWVLGRYPLTAERHAEVRSALESPPLTEPRPALS